MHVEKTGLLLKKITCLVVETGSRPRAKRCLLCARKPVLFTFIYITKVKYVKVGRPEMSHSRLFPSVMLSGAGGMKRVPLSWFPPRQAAVSMTGTGGFGR